MRQIARVGVAVGILAATSFARFDVAHAATSDEYYAQADGQYATIEGRIAGGIVGNLFSGQLTLGEVEARLSSEGVDKLNGFKVPDGTKSGARGDLATGGVAGFKLWTDHVKSTAPVESGPASTRYLPIPLGPILHGGVINADSKAKWDGLFKSAAPTQVASEVVGDTANLDFLNLGDLLGDFSALLPKQLQKPVVSLNTVRVKMQTGTVRNADGTHGLTAGGTGGLAQVQILGGAANGGITLGLVNNDEGGEKDTAGSRVWATGKPGGAGCSYEIPDLIKVKVGSAAEVSLPLSVGSRIPFPFGLGYLDFRLLGQSHCESSADGTFAQATGAGVGLKLHLQLPAVTGMQATELGSFTLTLPDMNAAEVKVPKGGIPPTDPPTPTPTPTPTDDPTVEPPADNGGPNDVPSVVDSGLANTSYDVRARWTVPLGAGVLLILTVAWRQWRRILAAD